MAGSWTLMAAVAVTCALGPPARALGAPVKSVFPGANWTTRTPSELGLDQGKLDALSSYLGGRGCVVRYGYLVYTWGSQSERGDIASAAKPFISHFLFKALDDARIPSLDQTVSAWEPRLNGLNPSIGYKDAKITWRHMANQISCYGVSEQPGTAYDYNDYQMALLWDTLFLNVYKASYSSVDSTVLHAMLTDPMQCQDNPTFMAFGTDRRQGRVRISVRDHARFGLLYRNAGNWNGKQLLSRSLAEAAISSALPNSIPRTTATAAEMIPGQRSYGGVTIPDDQADHDGSYSWLWWTNGVGRGGERNWPDAPMDSFGAFGHENGKRAVVVIPSLDLVAAWNDTTLDRKPGNPRNEALRLLAESVISGHKPMDGQIVPDPARPQCLKREGRGPFFMCGPGDPEGFLYRGTRNPDGARAGDQVRLIDKLKGTGANCIYMQVVRSHGGDGDGTQNPFINSDPKQGLDQDILDQWEDWFAEMDRNGITIYLFLYDDSARIWKTGDTVGPAERDFIRGIVKRFEHHRNLIWCVAEEYGEVYSAERVSGIAAEIRAADYHRHPIAVHKNTGLDFSEFADNPNIDQFAIQYNAGTADEIHAGIVRAWNASKGRYNPNLAEVASHGTGETARKKSWAAAMGGASVMVLGMDIAGTAEADLRDCGRLTSFFQSTSLDKMSPRDDLAFGGTQYVLADPGKCYIAYASNLSSKIGLRGMAVGSCDFRWFDIVSGAVVEQTGVKVAEGDQAWGKPAGIGSELAVFISRRQEKE